ncbi:hypothetical protein [Vreelandella janggokensis]|uniref:hypothetical protein n=1 Tax=Vreelandella janggokensis TaxID=370767 RepID=UPI002862903C|nr:hypothetical protein [Halomonas janggokensis]MDR5887576.1 hypothetical protein [Halomonas janggokensis]
MKPAVLAIALLAGLASTANAQEIPRFDVEAHCDNIARFGGDFSNITYNGCIDMEQSAYNNLKNRWGDVPTGIRSECMNIATFGGTGDYMTLQGCIDMETSAANNQSEFSFD